MIRIRTIRQELAIPVTILAGEEPERGFSQKEYEKHLVGFMRAQLDLQSGLRREGCSPCQYEGRVDRHGPPA